MKHYYIFGLILLFILTFSTKSFAYDFTVNGLYYNLDTSDGTIYVTFGDEQYSGEVVVPSNVIYKDRNLKVSKIGSYAFSNNKDLISVTIENGIETIDNNAFELCDNLETITIPLSVTEINPYAFQGCKRLLSITIPKGLTRLSEGLFQNCDKLKEIEIPNNIEEIDNYCFKNCKSIKQIKIPGSVKKIGDFLGYKTNFTNGGGYSIAFKGEVFRGCDNLINIEIQEGVEIIGHATFQGCKKIETIDLPNSITYIGKLAFSHCTSLKTVSISNNLSWLDRNTFDGDEAIKIVIYKDRKDWNFKYINWIFEERLPNLFEHAYNVGYGGFANSHPTKLYLGRLFSDVIDSCLNLDSLEVMTIGKGCLNSDIGMSMHHSFEKASHLVYIYSMSIDPKEELDEAHFGFSNQTYLNAILFVPYGTKEKYLETYPWKNFFDIREMNIFDMWNGTNSVYEPTSLHSVRNCNNLKVSTDKELLTIENIEIGDIINIFNNNGINIYHFTANSNRMNIHLNKGLYFVKNNKGVVKAIVK